MEKINAAEINKYHLFIQKSVMDNLGSDSGLKGIMGRAMLYIFPPGTGFDPDGVSDNGKKLVEVKIRDLTHREIALRLKGEKIFKRDEHVTH